MGLSDATVISKIGLGLTIAAVLFDVIGFPTPYWFVVSSTQRTYGLFKTCIDFRSGSVCGQRGASFGWERATRSLNVLGFLIGLASLVLVVLYVAVKNENKLLQLIGLALAFVAGGFIIVGSSIFASEFIDLGLATARHLSWSFAFTIIGSLLFVAAGVVLLVDKLRG